LSDSETLGQPLRNIKVSRVSLTLNPGYA